MTERPRAAGQRRLRAAGRWLPLRVYLGAFLALFVVAALGTVVFEQNIAISLAGMVVLLLGALLLYRVVTAPLRRLSDAMGRATSDLTEAEVSPSGPAEVARLALRFNALIASVHSEIAERRRAEAVARESERNYRLLFDGNPQPLMVYDIETLAFLEVNAAATKTYGYTREEFLARTVGDVVTPDQAPLLAAVRTNPDLHRWGPWTNRVKDGSLIDVDITSIRLTYAGHEARLVVVEEFTERKNLRNQLEQSQRLETVGQLAGGLAHDFNNLLAVILNYADFLVDELPEGDLRHDVEEIQRAASRAADLTRQLLIFARREVANPQVLDVNDVVTGVEKLLRRTIGEDLELALELAAEIPCVRADPGQLEQVLLNLAVNSRDAMPDGGRLVIETSAVELDPRYAGEHPDVVPGPYVRISVSDTGTGMSQAVAARAFEPFFTTKGPGHGTGLGLATVYGIVTGAGGNISIETEAGSGTRVNIHLPVVEEPATAVMQSQEAAPRTGEGRTVLIVEDESAVLLAAARILSGQGYQVRMRSVPGEALIVLRDTAAKVDLLLTDVVMPDLSGVELGRQAQDLRPGLPVVYMSGYSERPHAQRGSLPTGAKVLRKPFTRRDLLAAIGEALDDDGRDG